MKKNNRECVICGKEYYYCSGDCKDINKPRWMTLFCGQNCHDLFEILNDYSYKIIDKEEAQMRLGEIEIPERDRISERFRIVLDEIQSTSEEA